MSMTPDQIRKVGMGLVPSPSPFLTPRPERRSRSDSRGLIDWSSNRIDKDKEVNVQVLLRCRYCHAVASYLPLYHFSLLRIIENIMKLRWKQFDYRPLSDEEQRLNVPKGITCNELKREVIVMQNVANKQVDKTFTFDRVFGPKAQQRSIYDQAIAPVVTEVLEGFNCTVFAYGQTGTGKTYTMEGGMRNKGGELPADAGVIPRAVRHIFDTLEAQNADYSMKVTFLELYNEEITDLLAPEDCSRSYEDKPKKPISLMEDGKGCVLVRGLEEEAVYSANEIYSLLERGAAKRRTADTLLNKRSSRSHSVFTITVHIKETTVGSEELIKCGKLNLVDLAGSENISRSGAREARAREAGEINKSLLTLGRVINALVEHSGHVPYRDSKLTRLLRDSLGGKTKTCIIATISPTANSLEETLSTLDYAHRAKNIRNKPEANQKMSKAVLLKDLYLEIEKMKQDVRAAREKNGVYVPHERFLQDEAEKKEKNEKIEQLEIDLNCSKKQLAEYHELYLTEQEKKLSCECDLKDCKITLENTKKALESLQDKYKEAISMLKQKEFYISKLMNSENCLIVRAKELRTKLHGASEDMTALFSKIDHKSRLEAENQGLLLTFGSQLDQSLKDLHRTILSSVSQQHQHIRSMEEHASSFIASKCDVTKVLESRIKNMADTCTSGVATLNELANMLQKKSSIDMEHMNSKISFLVASVENFFENAVLEAKNVVSDIQNSLSEQTKLLASSAQQQEEGMRRSLVSAQVISAATIDFFNDLSHRTSELVANVEKSQVDRCNQIAAFEKTFKEDAAKEEQLALEKVAAILNSLTAKKTSMVSEASRNIENSCLRDNKTLMEQMSSMQQVTMNAKTEVNEYMEDKKLCFMEDSYATAEITAVMENSIQECTERVEQSMQQWDNTQSAIKHINKSSIEEAEAMLKSKVHENQVAHEDFVSTCSNIHAEFNVKATDVKSSVTDSLMLDRESKMKLDSISITCLDLLQHVRDNHSESTQKMRNHAEKCLKKDYLVDQHTSTTPKKQVITVPSLASIEDMKTPAFEDLIANFLQRADNALIMEARLFINTLVLEHLPKELLLETLTDYVCTWSILKEGLEKALAQDLFVLFIY